MCIRKSYAWLMYLSLNRLAYVSIVATSLVLRKSFSLWSLGGFPLFCFPLEITNFLIEVKTILGSAGCIILFSSECRTWCCVKENVRSDRHHAEFFTKINGKVRKYLQKATKVERRKNWDYTFSNFFWLRVFSWFTMFFRGLLKKNIVRFWTPWVTGFCVSCE